MRFIRSKLSLTAKRVHGPLAWQCPGQARLSICTPPFPYLELLAGQAYGDDAGGAAHAAQVVGDGVAAHLEVVHDHRAEAGRRVEQRAVHHQDVDLRSSSTPTAVQMRFLVVLLGQWQRLGGSAAPLW